MLDIRNNGGGLFPAGLEVARMWLDSGDIVLIADSMGVRDTYDANGTALEASAPLAVLVNHGTASASEVSQSRAAGLWVSSIEGSAHGDLFRAMDKHSPYGNAARPCQGACQRVSRQQEAGPADSVVQDELG